MNNQPKPCCKERSTLYIYDEDDRFVIDKNKFIFDSCYCEYDECPVVEIYYCPMCGKKLEHDNTDCSLKK